MEWRPQTALWLRPPQLKGGRRPGQPSDSAIAHSHDPLLRVCKTGCMRSTHRRMLVEPSPTPTSGAFACPTASGLAAQPVPGRPRRSRARLRAGRGARQREYRRGRAGHHLAVAAQGLHPPRARHARRQLRSRPATGHRRCPPAQPASRPPRPWIRCSRPSTPASSPPVHGHRLSCMSGSAVTSSTPSWAPTWSSSCTARATPASPPPGSGDHLAG